MGIWGASTKKRRASRLVSPLTPVMFGPLAELRKMDFEIENSLGLCEDRLNGEYICFRDAIDQTSAKKCIEKYLHHSSAFRPTRKGRGNWYVVSPRPGVKILLFGTRHKQATYYEHMLKDKFRGLVKETGIKKVYYELDRSEATTAATMENSIHESLSDLDLKFGGLETGDLRDDIAEELGQKDYEEVQHIDHKDSAAQQAAERGESALGRLANEAYYSGCQQLNRLISLIIASHAPEEDDAIHRNIQWMKTVRAQVEKYESTAYVVGNFHLYGEHGLINMCLAERWQVKLAEAYNPRYRWPYTLLNEKWRLSRCPYFRKCVQMLNQAGWGIDMTDLDSLDEETRNCWVSGS